MAELTIRPARREEAKTIRELIHAVKINPMGLDWHRFLVAVNEAGEVIGCGQIKPHPDGSRELASIAVRAGMRQQGIASSLIQSLLEQVQRPIYLMCRGELEMFYNRFGFAAITEKEMPPHFRRISRMVRLFANRRAEPHRLAVMRLD